VRAVRVRGRDRDEAGPRGPALSDPRGSLALLAGLLALAGFLCATLQGPFHRHSHAALDRADHSHAESAVAARPSCVHEHRQSAPASSAPDTAGSPEGVPAAPQTPEGDHDCPICSLAGEARAPLPAEPIAPPRTEEPRAAHPPVISSAPAAPLLLAARPRAPPASS